MRSFETLLGEGTVDYVDFEAILMMMIVREVEPRRKQTYRCSNRQWLSSRAQVHRWPYCVIRSNSGYRELVKLRHEDPECKRCKVVQLASTIEEKGDRPPELRPCCALNPEPVNRKFAIGPSKDERRLMKSRFKLVYRATVLGTGSGVSPHQAQIVT